MPQDQAPKDQRTNNAGIDEPTVEPATGQSPLASGALPQREVTASVSIPLQEQSFLVHRKGESNTYQVPIASLGTGSVASRGSLVSKTPVSPRETPAQMPHGHSKRLEENTVSTHRSRPSVNPESSTPVSGPITPSPLIVSLLYAPYAIT